MARKTIQELLDQSAATLPDNNTQDISAADVRQMIVDFLDTIMPIYAGLAMSAPTVVPVTAVQTPITFDTILGQFPPDWVVTPNSMQRQLAGVAGTNTRMEIVGNIEGPGAAEVEVHLYKNGGPTPWKVRQQLLGPGKPVIFTFTALDYNTVDTTYEMRIHVHTGDVNVTLSDWIWIGENVPIRVANPAAFMA